MNSSPEPATKNFLEWTVFGLSGVIVLGVLGSLSYAALRVNGRPAMLRAVIDLPSVENGWVRVPVSVTNSGHRVAANVQVQVSAGSGGDKREGGFTIDFVPREGTHKGSVSFEGTELPQDLKCEVLGYSEP